MIKYTYMYMCNYFCFENSETFYNSCYPMSPIFTFFALFRFFFTIQYTIQIMQYLTG